MRCRAGRFLRRPCGALDQVIDRFLVLLSPGARERQCQRCQSRQQFSCTGAPRHSGGGDKWSAPHAAVSPARCRCVKSSSSPHRNSAGYTAAGRSRASKPPIKAVNDDEVRALLDRYRCPMAISRGACKVSWRYRKPGIFGSPIDAVKALWRGAFLSLTVLIPPTSAAVDRDAK